MRPRDAPPVGVGGMPVSPKAFEQTVGGVRRRLIDHTRDLGPCDQIGQVGHGVNGTVGKRAHGQSRVAPSPDP